MVPNMKTILFSTLLLSLVIHAGAQSLEFREADVIALERTFQNLKESTRKNAIIGYLACVDLLTPGNTMGISISAQTGRTNPVIVTPNRANTTILLNSEVDYENAGDRNDYKATFTCTKNGLTKDKTFAIVVADVNDNAPTFDKAGGINDSYVTTIDEVIDITDPVNGLLIYDAIRVTDIDGANNRDVVPVCVSLSSNPAVLEGLNCGDYFRLTADLINSDDKGTNYQFKLYALQGQLKAFQSFTLEILAMNIPKDQLNEPTLNSTSQNVLINIRDIQDSPPKILPNSLRKEISEDMPQGTIIPSSVQAYDQDTRAPNPIAFELIPDPTSDFDGYQFFSLGDVFQLENTENENYQVELILAKQIDREQIIDTTKNVYVQIRAYETNIFNLPNRNPMNATALITVNVLDVNDIAPTFNFDTYTISVNELQGTRTDNATQLVVQEGAIQVTDGDGIAYNSFNISIVPSQSSRYFYLDRYSGSGSQIFTLYILNEVLDYENVLSNQFTITLESVDVDNPSFRSQAVVNVAIQDLNDQSPQFTRNSYSFSFPENEMKGYLVGTVSATDDDSGLFGLIAEYELRDSSNTFVIDNQGNIKLDKPVDYEVLNRYEFTVTAKDSDPRFPKETTVTVSVDITNIIDTGPLITGEYQCQVFEETVELQPQIVVQAVNQEADVDIVFSLRSVVPNQIDINEYFLINPSTGNFSLRKPINFRNTDNGLLKVLVRASAVGRLDLFSEKNISITVQNLNNHPPVFVPPRPNNFYYASISESAGRGFVVITLNTTDADEEGTPGGTVKYQILSGANDDFTIDEISGTITVGADANLNYDDSRDYSIVVRALDSGTPSKSAQATVVVSLEDSNNNDPFFTTLLYQFQVNESQAIGTEIGRVSARDLDTDSQLVYSLLFQSATFEINSASLDNPNINLEDLIRIEEVTGIIRVNGIITRNVFDRIQIQVDARDVNGEFNTPQIGRADVVITVVATPDPNIVFDPPWTPENPVITIPQPESDIRSTAPLYKLRAEDPSISENINIFRKVFSSDAGDFFSIRNSSIVLKKALDFEALPGNLGNTKPLTVVVEAISDDLQRTGTATIVFQVNDVNDNAPVFTEREYVATIYEDQRYPARVLQMTVTDLDSGTYGLSSFSIEGADGVFAQDTGDNVPDNVLVIRVAEGAVLDYEQNQFYNIRVTATDNLGGDSGQQTSITVRINLEDVNDNAPQFRQEVYEFNIIDTAQNDITVGRVLAEDVDIGASGKVVYTIIPGEGSQYFDIGPEVATTATVGNVFQIGRIFVKSSLEDLPDRYQFNMTILATDRGSPTQLSNTCNVLITVIEVFQDPKPRWAANLPTRVRIPERSPIGTFVATLLARSANVSSGITYSFVTSGNIQGDYNKYSIDRNTGTITTNAELDFEEQKIYQGDGSVSASTQLLILATDTSNNTLTNQYLLVVEIIDIDDNDPTFQNCTDKTYSIPEIATIMEALPEGQLVYIVEACDDDEAPNNDVAYQPFIPIPGSNVSNLCPNQADLFGSTFELDPISGHITTLESLDRETIPEYLLCIQALKRSRNRKKRGVDNVPLARTLHDVLFLKVIVQDANDNGPVFTENVVTRVILPYPLIDFSVAEATDADLAPYNDIRYTIEDIKFTKNGITYSAPAACTIDANDGSLSAVVSNYNEYAGGYFTITIKAEDYNSGNTLTARQVQKIYVANPANQIRVVLDRPADSGVESDVGDMIQRLNNLQEGVFYEVQKISYHVLNNEDDPLFDRTDVCMLVVQDNTVLTAFDATKFLEQQNAVNTILDEYGAREPGPCDPAKSVYPQGWDSYWWVLVAFAIFIFVCVLILIFIILSLYSGYKRYIDTRRTYLVPGN